VSQAKSYYVSSLLKMSALGVRRDFLFEIDEPRLDRRFLDYFIRTRAFREQVEATKPNGATLDGARVSSGTTVTS
jgi:hypothetical protein